MVRYCLGCKKPMAPRQIVKERADGSKSLVRLPGPARCEECAARCLRTYNRNYKREWREKRREKGASA